MESASPSDELPTESSTHKHHVTSPGLPPSNILSPSSLLLSPLGGGTSSSTQHSTVVSTQSSPQLSASHSETQNSISFMDSALFSPLGSGIVPHRERVGDVPDPTVSRPPRFTKEQFAHLFFNNLTDFQPTASRANRFSLKQRGVGFKLAAPVSRPQGPSHITHISGAKYIN
jgi:hypothetical protein